MSSSDDQNDSPQLSMLLAEIDSAEAMLAATKCVRDPTTSGEYKQNALEAYQGCLGLILRTRMGHERETEVWNRLAHVRHWLEVNGLLKTQKT